jgi:membrane-bound metal-dependent hydrolase YbcI (DUF457 family)
MFIGHFAVGFASKRYAPNVSFAVLLAAPLLLDLLWPIALLLGVETVRIDPGNTRVTPLDLHDYPWTHSLLMSVVWSVLFAGCVFLATRRGPAAVVTGLGVFSHWVLDFVTHRPDMPLWPGSSVQVGLGLWNSLPGTLALEVLLFVLGLTLFGSTVKAKGRSGVIAFGSLVAFLCVAYVGAIFGPPPPSEKAIAWAGVSTWLFVLWAHWVERTHVRRGG